MERAAATSWLTLAEAEAESSTRPAAHVKSALLLLLMLLLFIERALWPIRLRGGSGEDCVCCPLMRAAAYVCQLAAVEDELLPL